MTTDTSLQGDFAKIALNCVTDKVSHHGYHRFYPRFLETIKYDMKGKGMLEIGINQIDAIDLWRKYFPKVFIYGVDIGIPETKGDDYHVFCGDQSDMKKMESIISEISHPIPFIIDDGSHLPSHQIMCFNYLFRELLSPGGIYIIEDIETSYWNKERNLYGRDFQNDPSVIDVFQTVINNINEEFIHEEKRNTDGTLISLETRKEIQSVTFGMNCIIITKKTLEDKERYDNRKYRFGERL